MKEPYNAQREFPRDRFTSEHKDGADWPVATMTAGAWLSWRSGLLMAWD